MVTDIQYNYDIRYRFVLGSEHFQHLILHKMYSKVRLATL